jgi:hypothetical protein
MENTTTKDTLEAASGSRWCTLWAGTDVMAPARVEEAGDITARRPRHGSIVGDTPFGHTAPMVLITPHQGAMFSPTALPEVGSDGATGAPSGEPVPARDEVLALLRDGSGRRPRFDPGLAGGLRAWLEDGVSELAASRGDDAPPLFLGPRLLWDGPPAGGEVSAAVTADPRPYPIELVTSCLVRALFRQVVTTGEVGDPLADGVEALRVDPGRAGMVQHIDALPAPALAALSASLSTHVAHLINLTPRFAAGWLPRTDDRVAIPLAGGRVVLCGVFDLLVGAPVPGTATLCALGLTTGGRWAQARTALHYLALLETLRSGNPPFRLALLHSAVGRYGVEDVLEEHLRAVVSHVVARLSAFGETHG